MKRNVLLISADPNKIESLEAAIRKGPYRAIIARTAAEGLVTLESSVTAVVVADEMLADVSGRELLSIVANDHPETLRILLTTDISEEPTANLLEQADVHRLLARDTAEQKVIEAIRAILPDPMPMPQVQTMKTAPSKPAEDLERTYPGITFVRRSRDGSIDASGIKIESVTEDIRQQLEALAG